MHLHSLVTTQYGLPSFDLQLSTRNRWHIVIEKMRRKVPWKYYSTLSRSNKHYDSIFWKEIYPWMSRYEVWLSVNLQPLNWIHRVWKQAHKGKICGNEVQRITEVSTTCSYCSKKTVLNLKCLDIVTMILYKDMWGQSSSLSWVDSFC